MNPAELERRRRIGAAPLRSYRPIATLAREPGTGRPLIVRLSTGILAYYQRRSDDCWAAVVATSLQVPIDQVPDARIDERLAGGENPDEISCDALETFERWVAARGLRVVRHDTPPLECGGWIGLDAGDGTDRFSGHAVVMCEDRLVFDPASNWPTPPGTRVAPPGPILAGITFEPLEAR